MCKKLDCLWRRRSGLALGETNETCFPVFILLSCWIFFPLSYQVIFTLNKIQPFNTRGQGWVPSALLHPPDLTSCPRGAGRGRCHQPDGDAQKVEAVSPR